MPDDRIDDVVVFEAVVRSETGASMFAKPGLARDGDLRAVAPSPDRAAAAANELRRLGFRIRHVGTFSISGEAPRALWEQTFRTRLQRQYGSGRSFLLAAPNEPFELPAPLTNLVERAYPQRPPIMYSLSVSPVPPRVTYHHLRVPDDVALVLRAAPVHEQGITGKDVRVVMVDTGFYAHPFYRWHGYRYRAILAPDATGVEHDDYGHGTAEAANVFAAAPGADFVGVKMGDNPTLAVKTGVDLAPAVLSCSWGYDLAGIAELPNDLKPLEAAVAEAVHDKGIVVCCSAGNGQVSFPGMMPDVISAGGVYASDAAGPDDFALKASSYASSFTGGVYAGRLVPDVCGLVGMPPSAVYLMLPVQPGDTIDGELAASAYPDGDDTAARDGWAALSGTSAAAPQLAGVCALLKQARPDLTPDRVKAILTASARDVITGSSAMGDKAARGVDRATGAGLVDAAAAVRLASA